MADTSFGGFLNQAVVEPTKTAAKKALKNPYAGVAASLIPGVGPFAGPAVAAYQIKQPIAKAYNDYVLTQQRQEAAKNKSKTPSTPMQIAPTTQKTTTGGTTGGVSGTTSTTATTKSTGKSKEQLYQDQVSKQISDAYKQQINFLNQQAQNLQSQLPEMLQTVASPFEQQLPTLQSQLEAQQQQGAQEIQNTQLAEQQGLAATRRSGAEQIQRAQQQFGGVGGSSAAEAAGTVIGQQQLRNLGNIMQQSQAGQQNIQNQLRAIQSEYNANVAKLQLQKEQALSAARLDFNKQLQAIESAKLQAGQTKSSQTIQALQDFAQRRRQLEDQSTAFQQQLEAARQQAAMAASQFQLQQQIASQGIVMPSGANVPNAEQDKIGRRNLIASVASQQGGIENAGWNVVGIEPNGTVIYKDKQGTLFDNQGNLR